MKRARKRWVDGQNDLDPGRLIFIDESGLSTNMARPRGWAPKGERCRAAIPYGHWKTITFVGGLTFSGFVAPMLLDGSMNGECFRAWIEQMLAPALQPGHIVVMDNLSAHKVAGVKDAIETRGAELLYLPPYSPDLNPIENAFLPAGKLDVDNKDPVLHNTHGYYGNRTAFNKALPNQNQIVPTELTRAGTVRVECDVHDWMLGWIFVVDNPYYALTGPDGKFSITDVPPGTYKLVATQSFTGPIEQSVTVAGGKPTTLTIELKK